MNLKWKYKYKYALEMPYPLERVGKLLTGTVQVSREMTPAEVEVLAKHMLHGLADAAVLICCELLETTTGGATKKNRLASAM